jgi:hypothetical protein
MMSKKIKKEWRLNPQEVSCGMHSSSSGKTRQFERKLKTTSSYIFITHEPTGIRVEGEIPLGHYSKKEMQQMREALKQSLFTELERKVAAKLRVKGR